MEDHMMVMMRKKQSSTTTSPSNSSSPLVALGMHKDSHDEFKVKPKIRIIHIFAPEIIKTDVENFRELVQRLTGKPSPSDYRGSNKKSRISRKQKQDQQPRNNENSKKGNDQMVQIQEVKEEEEMWKSNSSNSNSNSNSNSGGFLSGFADLDGFIEELDHFSMMHPIGPNNHMLAFGESQLA